MRLPDLTQRIAIVGRTGSGKTQAGVWHLSQKDFNRHKWLIFDFKNDELINSIEGVHELSVGEAPKRSGLYITHPTPKDEDDVEKAMWKIWENENTGVFVDEGYMIGNRSPAMNALLTQGRSKRIPMIVLSQRPAWMSRFVFSEADFYQVFGLADEEDHKRVRQFIPNYKRGIQLPRYHSIYHDVSEYDTVLLTPVPERDAILDAFSEKLRRQRRII